MIFADHQNKPDLGAGIARQWYDTQGVDMILDVPTSSVGLAVGAVAKEKDRAYLNIGAATADLTGKQCAPCIVHWSYDTYMLAKSTGGATVRAGGDTWYFITADYVFGHQLQRDATSFIQAAGGKVLGASAYPFPGTSDFSAFLLQAQASGAKVLGLCNAGADTVNSIKQAKEFGLQTRIAALLMFITDVHALGLQTAQGLTLTESFYWDLNDRTRAFTERVRPKTPNNWPNMIHAGCYAASAAFPQGGGRHGRRGGEEERCRHRQSHEGDADRRRRLRKGAHPRGRVADRAELPVRGEEALRESRPLGLLQDRAGHTGRPGLAPAGRGRLLFRQDMRQARQKCAA